MKQYFVALILGMISFVDAKAVGGSEPSSQCRPVQMVLDGIERSAEQEGIVEEMRAFRKNEPKNRTRQHKNPSALILAFLDGELSRQDIEREQEARYTRMVERNNLLHSLVSSYSEQQKEQVRTNLRRCNDAASQRKSYDLRKNRKITVMFRNVNLTEEQEAVLHELQAVQRPLPPRRMAEKIITDALEDSASFEDDAIEAEMQKHVRILFDLLESLSEEQRAELRENIARHAERRQQRRGRLHDSEKRP